ncbi:BPL-N domain-containing protein [Microdochium nivale]|nr:BPL-N domain-containing protein [Microdochium nivale]
MLHHAVRKPTALLAALLTITMASLSCTVAAAATAAAARPRAIVYRGPASSPGCSEAIGQLLSSSPENFEIIYAGPREPAGDVTPALLASATVYAHGGGPDLDTAYGLTRQYQDAIRKFVSEGGHYLGFCLGAYLAGHKSGYGLLPAGVGAGQEIKRKHAQVKGDEDTVIRVDWTFTNGKKETGRSVYFQDGVVLTGLDDKSCPVKGRILSRYSANGDVAAAVLPFGKGWVRLVGPHPEADQVWYDDAEISNPEGVKFDIGYDFVRATLNGGKLSKSGRK